MGATASRHPHRSSPDPAAAARRRRPRPRPAAHAGASRSSSSGGGDVDVPVQALPRDVLFDILLRARLPARQLCRLRGVCRSWRAVLSDPLFVAAHASHHPDLLVAAADLEDLLLGSSVVRRLPPSRPGDAPPTPPRRMRAHLGRVLVVGADYRPLVVDLDTGAESLLPPDHGRHRDPSTFFVLGWAAAAAGYKVLNVTRDRGRHVHRCRVLTLRGALGSAAVAGGLWKEAPDAPVVVVGREPWYAAVAGNGVVYVYGYVAARAGVRADWGIAAFDLNTERWRRGLLRGPPSKNDDDDALSLSSLTTTDTGGHLVAVSGSFRSASAVHLWRLMSSGDNDDGDDPAAAAVWHKMCTVHASRIQRDGAAGHRHGRFDFGIESPLWVLAGGRIAFLVSSPDHRWVLRMYDPRTGGYEDVARVRSSLDVAVGVYSANNLLRVQRVHQEQG